MKKLQKTPFEKFNIADIKPEGWLEDQLLLQRKGLSGNLDLIYDYIKDSNWLGGNKGDWERVPYWLDGAIPLAWLLNDDELKHRIRKYIDYIISNQSEDGWLGPKSMNHSAYNAEKKADADLWGAILFTKVLTQYHEITGDEKVLNALIRVLKYFDKLIDDHPLFNWGQFRWFEVLFSIFYLYEKQPEKWLLHLAVKFKSQGFNWKSFFKKWPMKDKTPQKRWNFMSHVVNNAMAVKSGSLWWKLSGKKSDIKSSYKIFQKLIKYHGTAAGIATGDECLAGKSPVQGSELCSVVELMFSLENLLLTTGDFQVSDSLEKIAFNALPAAFTEDMWAHQYDQQANQIECSMKENRTWTTNKPEANIFGLEPDIECCTCNFSQGWPKFAANLWYKTEDNGIASAIIAPSTLSTDINNVNVSIKLKTDYPFKHNLKYEIISDKKVKFPFYIKIPSWCEKTEVKIDGSRKKTIKRNGFIEIENSFNKNKIIEVEFKTAPQLIEHFEKLVYLKYGALVFSLPVEGEFRRINADDPRKNLPHGDWELYPKSEWNFALKKSNVDIVENDISSIPFSQNQPPVILLTEGQKIKWKNVNGSAENINGKNVELLNKYHENITLIPYGCTKLRITEFPLIKQWLNENHLKLYILMRYNDYFY